MSELETFKAKVEAFIEREGVNATQFGKRFANDPGFVFGLRAGREPRSGTRQKVMDGMAEATQAAA